MFAQHKRESLRKLQTMEDKSPKGCIDEPISDMIKVTSSSCSGRIAVFCGKSATVADNEISTNLITKGGKWLIAEHATITLDQLVAGLHSPHANSSTSNMIIFKHEPFIMHVVCRDLDSAKELLQLAIAGGFRESGIVLGNRKTMCAIRTMANGLEIPLGRSAEQLLVNKEYLQWIVDIANQKFIANKQKTDRFFGAFRAKFSNPSLNLKTIHQFDVNLSSWKELPREVSVKLVGHSSVHYKDTIVVFGGQGLTASGTTTRVADVSYLSLSKDGSLQHTYHVATGDDGPVARMYHSAVVVGTQMIVFGGRASPAKPLGDLFAFDLETKVWVKILPDGVGPSPRWKHSCCAMGSVVYIYGGRDTTQVFSDLFALDLATAPQWRRIQSSFSSPCRFDHVGATVGLTKLVVWGGMSSLEDGDNSGESDSSACFLFDTVKETWNSIKLTDTTNNSHPPALFGASASSISNHQVVVVGGITSALLANRDKATQKVYLLDVETSQWSELSEVKHDNAAFVGHSTAWLSTNSSLYILGGGFQCFGFGQFYSSTYQCHLSITRLPNDAIIAGKSKFVSTSTTSVSASSVSRPLGVLVGKLQVKKVKTLLEKLHVYDKSRRVHVAKSAKSNEELNPPTIFLLPVVPTICDFIASTNNDEIQKLKVVSDDDAHANKFGKTSGLNRNELIRSTITAFASQHGIPAEMQQAIPEKYEFVSDVLLIPRDSFLESEWASFADEMWAHVCASTTPAFTRVARKAFIDASEKRQSHVKLVYVNEKGLVSQRNKNSRGWVEIRENGIVYGWDLTKVMFSSGNVTEKARMANIGCRGETIVDLFCGIGYYVLPFLVHGGAALVHACEWNPDSVAALRFNLERNHVADRCKVHVGDNRESVDTIGAVADRVNLGLLPTSKKAWPLAVQVLKSTGGWFHVHDNVAVEDRKTWEQHVLDTMRALAEQYDKHWTITCEHVERVKSYAPKDVMETEVKRRLGAHMQRRGDGFTEAESMGLLQLVRSNWREGWDVVAQLHNAQFAKHNRSADSLKKKFSRLYRSNIPPRGAKNHQAIAFAHIVHKEMIEGVPPAPSIAIDGETPVDSSLQPLHDDERGRDGTTESENNWEDTAAKNTATSSSDKAAGSVPPTAAIAVPRARHQTTEWHHSAAALLQDATSLPTDDLLTSVLKVILRSQYQRDLDREEELQRWEEEKQRRRAETEQRRLEEERRRDEEREERRRRSEERRRRSEERAEERAENSRRHEQLMQMMMLLVSKKGNEQQGSES